MITNFTLFCSPLFGLTWFNLSLSLLIRLTSSRLDFVHLFSTWFNRYECYDKLFLTSLILNRLTRWLILLFLTLFDFFYSYVALCHSLQLQSCHLDFSHLDSTQITATRYISFRPMLPRLNSIVVSLRLKLSLTLLWLNRFAKWFQPIVSRFHLTQSHSLHRISNALRFISFLTLLQCYCCSLWYYVSHLVSSFLKSIACQFHD